MERQNFLEISPCRADEAELIGKHPGDVPSEILDPDEQDEIEAEVIAWKRLIEAFAHAERSVEMAERRGA